MLRWFYILFFTLISCIGLAQNRKTDSLRNLLAQSSGKARLAVLVALTDELDTKNFDDAISMGTEGLELAGSLNDSLSMALLERAIGNAEYFRGHFDKAASHFYRSIGILERANQPAELAHSLNTLAKLYRKTRELDRAMENYDRALSIFRQLKDSAGQSMILNESGVVFEYREDFPRAIERYKASLRICERKRDSVGIGYALNFIGGALTLQKKFDEAEQYLRESLEIRIRMADTFAIALSFSDLGMMYAAKGDEGLANMAFAESNKLAELLKYPELLSNNYGELANIAKNQGDYKSAFELFQKRTALRDSIYTDQYRNQITELQARYDSEKQARKIQDQEYQLKRRNTIIAVAGALVLLGGLLAWSSYKRYRLRQEARLQQEMIRQQELAARAVMDAEDKERTRIAADLHDGVGQTMSAARMNLSALENELDLKDEKQQQALEKIMALVDESCREVRAVSHSMMPQALLTAGLPAAISQFLSRIDEKVLRSSFYSEGLENERPEASTETILYRVIQECVNNTLKHARATQLDISLIRDEHGLSATIEDNGEGFDMAAVSDEGGLGLKNIRTRIAYLRGTVDFDSAPGRGTLVAIHIPMA